MLQTITTKPGDKYRSIKNPRVYEALRKRGMSKQSAARISNAQAHKAYTLAQLEAFVSSPHYDPQTAGLIAANVPEIPRLKGEQLSPGVTRIRGNLCNVHGRYGPCDAALSGKKKPGKGRKPRKPAKPKKVAQTPDEKRAARTQEQAANREQVMRALNIAPDGQQALEALRAGAQPDPQAIARGGFEAAGLVERATDGSYRLSASGRAALSAANSGDLGRTGDIISSARDRATARGERATAAEGRKRQSQAKREQAAQLRAKRLARRTSKQSAKSFTVFKDASGNMRWVAQSSTAYQDRDKEIVSTKALADDCAFADKTGSYGPLRWWHCAGLDLGDCDFNAMHGRILIESGTFRSPQIAQKVAAAADSLEISLGFLHLPTEPDASGVFHHIRRFERSLVPRGKAANRFTAFRVKETVRMDATKVAALKTLGFSDSDITELEARATATEKAADDQQTAYKADEAEIELPDMVINGITYKAFPPKADEPVVEAVVEEQAIDDMPIEEEADTGGMTLSPEDLSAIGEAVGAALQAGIAQIMGALDLEKKVAGHVQGLLAPYTATKDATDAARAEQIAALQTSLKATQDQLNELLGLQPEVAPRASAAPASVLNPFNPADAALLATVKDQVPVDQQQYVNGFEDLKIKLFGS